MELELILGIWYKVKISFFPKEFLELENHNNTKVILERRNIFAGSWLASTEAIASFLPVRQLLKLGAFAVYCTRPETDTQVVLGSDLVFFLFHFQGRFLGCMVLLGCSWKQNFRET